MVVPAVRISSRAVLNQWVQAFGLELVFSVGDGEVVNHSELRLGDGWVMAGTEKSNEFDRPPGSASTYWVLDDAAAVVSLHARALQAGAREVNAPYEPDYGGRECSLEDADGNTWSFGTYAPGNSH